MPIFIKICNVHILKLVCTVTRKCRLGNSLSDDRYRNLLVGELQTFGYPWLIKSICIVQLFIYTGRQVFSFIYRIVIIHQLSNSLK